MSTAREFHHNSSPLSDKMQQALASLALEGIKLPQESLEDIRKLDSGEMPKKEYLKRVKLRAQSQN
jgi:hypothetical protein